MTAPAVGAPSRGLGQQVVDRDGTTVRGTAAVALVLSRLPLTAWFALPALLLPAVRRARRSPTVIAAGPS